MKWISDKLGNLTDVISGSTPNSEVEVYWGGEHVWITPTDLGKLDGVYISSSERKVTNEGLRDAKLTLIPRNSVVMSSRAPIGYLGITTRDSYTNQGCKSFVCSSKLDALFLYYSLKRQLKKLQSLGSGSTFAEVSKSMLEDFIIYFPEDVAHQKKIASNLKTQFAEIEKTRKAAEIIRGDIKRLKHLTLENFFSEFHETKKFALGKKAETTSGSTPSRGQKKYWEPAEIPWIKTGEIDFLPITEAKEYISAKALKECSLKLLPENTVLVAMVGQGKTRGKSAVTKISVTTNQNSFAILPNDTWEPEFLQLWLMYSYQDLRNMSESRGGNQPNFSCNVLNQVEVPAPPLDVQKEVVLKVKVALDEIDKLSNTWSAKFEDINSLSNKILEEVFNEFEYE